MDVTADLLLAARERDAFAVVVEVRKLIDAGACPKSHPLWTAVETYDSRYRCAARDPLKPERRCELRLDHKDPERQHQLHQAGALVWTL